MRSMFNKPSKPCNTEKTLPRNATVEIESIAVASYWNKHILMSTINYWFLFCFISSNDYVDYFLTNINKANKL